MNRQYREMIADEFRDCVDRTIDRVLGNEQTYRPFHSALLSDDVLFWSSFERSFSTSFGQRVIEELARLVALSNGAEDAARQVETTVVIDSAREEAIRDHMQMLRNGRHMNYAWDDVVDSILAIRPSGRSVRLRVISDLWWRKDGTDNFVSLKTVKPNIDQTAVAKEDCLHLVVGRRNCNAYFGLPYNPYGENREDYAFNPPMGIFDFYHDPVVLIGRDLWDTIGGHGCYEDLLRIAEEVGYETKQKINRMRH